VVLVLQIRVIVGVTDIGQILTIQVAVVVLALLLLMPLAVEQPTAVSGYSPQ
tara:strand:- start:142 stop:297 length:156 start_codon:yes stop_codon:yes gene_type:complete